MFNRFKAFYNNESGATALEYGLIVSMIALAIIYPLTDMGIAISGMFARVLKVLRTSP